MPIKNYEEFESQFALLPLKEQMVLLERLMVVMRKSAYLDISQEEWEAGLEEMANDPAIQRELRMQPHPHESPGEAKESA
jgi:hypothetical protein